MADSGKGKRGASVSAATRVVEIAAEATGLVKSVAQCASTDQARPGLMMLVLEPVGGKAGARLATAPAVHVWACDSYRIGRAVATGGTDVANARGWDLPGGAGGLFVEPSRAGAISDDRGRVILPAAAVAKAITGKGGKHALHVDVTPDDDQPAGWQTVTVAYGDKRERVTYQLSASVPDAQQLWPDDPGSGRMTVPHNGDDLAALAKVARAIDRTKPLAVFAGGQLTDGGQVHARVASECQTFDYRVPVTAYHDMPAVWGVNATYLAAACQLAAHAAGGQVTLRARDHLKPYIIGDPDTVAALVMPVRVADRGEKPTGVRMHLSPEHGDVTPDGAAGKRDSELAKVTASVHREAKRAERAERKLAQVTAERDRLASERAEQSGTATADDVARYRERIADLESRVRMARTVGGASDDEAVRALRDHVVNVERANAALARERDQAVAVANEQRAHVDRIAAAPCDRDHVWHDGHERVAPRVHVCPDASAHDAAAMSDAIDSARARKDPTGDVIDVDDVSDVADEPADEPQRLTKAQRRERNRQLAAALRAAGITPNGDPWADARALVDDGASIAQAVAAIAE